MNTTYKDFIAHQGLPNPKSTTLDEKIEMAKAKLNMTSIAKGSEVSYYDRDVPITMYSETVKNVRDPLSTSIYHTAPTGKNPFAKNTDFTTPVQEYKKGTTKD